MFLLKCFIISSFSVSTNALTSQELGEFESQRHTETNTNLQGTVSVDTTSDANNYIITSNGIPDHMTGTFPQPNTNPNSIKKQALRFVIPRNPTPAATASCLTFGPIAVSKNGVPLFNPNNINSQNAVLVEVFDSCNGHPDNKGIYHYHQTPICLKHGVNDEFIGVALDGFPIYGSKDSTGKLLTSADLDSCHGHMYNGMYRYRLTADYPYIMGCFKGTRADQRELFKPPEDCLTGSGSAGGGQAPSGGGSGPSGGGPRPSGGSQDPSGGGQVPPGVGQVHSGGGQGRPGGGQDPSGGGQGRPGGGQVPSEEGQVPSGVDLGPFGGEQALFGGGLNNTGSRVGPGTTQVTPLFTAVSLWITYWFRI